MKKPLIAVTIGDPAGIGPEIVVKTIADKDAFEAAACIVIGDAGVIRQAIDVTGTDAQPGDFAIIFGDQLPIIELANKLSTIPYEILTSVSRRVQRVYFYE